MNAVHKLPVYGTIKCYCILLYCISTSTLLVLYICLQNSPNSGESTVTKRENNDFSSSALLTSLRRAKTDICFTSVGQTGSSDVNESRITSAALSIPSTRRTNFNRDKNLLSYRELRIIQRAKVCSRRHYLNFFVFRLLPSGVATAISPSPLGPIFCILLLSP